jgi:hypothetical protein
VRFSKASFSDESQLVFWCDRITNPTIVEWGVQLKKDESNNSIDLKNVNTARPSTFGQTRSNCLSSENPIITWNGSQSTD